MQKCWEYADIFVVSTIAERVYFVACTTAYMPKPCFWSQIPWWPHLMNIHWEWSFHGRHRTAACPQLISKLSLAVHALQTAFWRPQHIFYECSAFKCKKMPASPNVKVMITDSRNGLYAHVIKSFEICNGLWQNWIIPRWPCAVDKTIKSNYCLNDWPSGRVFFVVFFLSRCLRRSVSSCRGGYARFS